MTDPIKRGGGVGPTDGAPDSNAVETPRTEGFREALQTGRAEGAAEAGKVEGPDAVPELRQLASELEAGRLSPEQIVEALVARQLRSSGAQMLAPAQRAELESLLRSRLADDPTLLALGRDLARGR